MENSVDSSSPELAKTESLSSEQQITSRLVGPFSAFMYGLNNNIGTGILALPLSFQGSGLILSSVLLMAFGLQLFTTCSQYFELTARYWHVRSPDHEYTIPERMIVHLPALTREVTTNKKIGIFFYSVMQISLIYNLFIIIVTYANAVPTSMMAIFNFKSAQGLDCINPAESDYPIECRNEYWIWIAIFMAFQVLLSFFDLSWQSWLQNACGIYRWIVVVILVILPAIHISRYGADKQVNYDYTSMSGFGYLVPTLVFSLGVHTSLSYIYEPLKNKNKNCNPVFFWIMIISCLFYLISAILNNIAYGSSLSPLITTNYATDTFLNTRFEMVLQKILIWYPGIAITTGTPTLSFPLAESCYDLLPKSFPRKWIYMVVMRILVCAVCCIMAMFVTSFTMLVNLSSLTGYFVLYLIPSGLILATKDLKSKSSTFYRWWCSDWYCWVTIIFGVFFFILSCIYV